MSIRTTPALLSAALLALTISACADSSAPTITDPDPDPGPEPSELGPPPEYQVLPPEGKLPWPQHAPDFDEAAYQAMLDELWVVNNFGLFQGSDNPETVYLHDALDVVLPNGTPIHAVERGVVFAVMGTGPYYATVMVESLDEPGMGWGYTHIWDLTVESGDTVHQGTVLGQVSFQGLEHVHLSRIDFNSGTDPNPRLGSGEMEALHPDEFFVYTDTEAPVFDPVGLRYVRNETDSAFLAPQTGEPVTVNGDVDIVAGLRDPGEWTRSSGPAPYGNRHSPRRIEFTIADDQGAVVHDAVGIDFDRIALGVGGAQRDHSGTALILYQHYPAVQPAAPENPDSNERLNYYILTNSSGSLPDRPLQLLPADADRAWRTAELDEFGDPRFPDGEYVITVRAYDSADNMATWSETVRVANTATLAAGSRVADGT